MRRSTRYSDFPFSTQTEPSIVKLIHVVNNFSSPPEIDYPRWITPHLQEASQEYDRIDGVIFFLSALLRNRTDQLGRQPEGRQVGGAVGQG